MFLIKHARFILLTAFLVVSIFLSMEDSATMDEKAHIPASYSYVKYQDMRLNPEHPPIAKDLAGLPLLAFNLEFPVETEFWQSGINEQWSLGADFLHSGKNNAEKILLWSRLPIILIALILGLYIYAWTYSLAGKIGAAAALTLFATDPNIIGHSHYVTTDIPIAAAIFISYFYFLKFLKKPQKGNIFKFGLTLGIAQLAKFSAVLLFPIYAIVIFIYVLFKVKRNDDELIDEYIEKEIENPFEEESQKIPKMPLSFKIKNISNYLFKYCVALFVCFVTIWLVYFANTYNMPAEKINDIANYVFPDDAKGNFAKNVITNLSSVNLLKPFAQYFLGVFMVLIRVSGGNTYYFLGQVYTQATAQYFPILFIYKSTIPFLILLGIAFIISFIRAFQTFFEMMKKIKRTNIMKTENKLHTLLISIYNSIKEYFQKSAVTYSIIIFIAIYIFLSITGNLNIGIRHLFPIYPFLYLLLCYKIFPFVKHLKSENGQKIFYFILALLFLWAVSEPIRAYPNYLSYYNELAGGHTQGYKIATDSNYDWGQDLKRLSDWINEYNENCYEIKDAENDLAPQVTDNTDIIIQEKHCPYPHYGKIDKIRIDYFGGSDPKYYLGDKFIPWHDDIDSEPGWYAISAGPLQESIYKKKSPGEKSYDWLNNYNPVIRPGDSIFVYYVPESTETLSKKE